MRFAAIGAAAFLLTFYIDTHWRDFVAFVLGRGRLGYAQQPLGIRALREAINAIPWIVCAGLFLLGLVRARWVPLLAFGGAQVAGVATIMGMLIFVPMIEDYASRIPFESTAWKADHKAWSGVRIHMVDDLLRRYALVGMKRAQVSRLLGPPSETDYFREYDLVYYLGPERHAFGIDSEWLVVKVRGETAIEARILHD